MQRSIKETITCITAVKNTITDQSKTKTMKKHGKFMEGSSCMKDDVIAASI